jgi:hypothetical protein
LGRDGAGYQYCTFCNPWRELRQIRILNRADAAVRRFLLWCFRNRETGTITVAQTPNLALSVFLVTTAILWLTHLNGAISTAAKVIATGSLIVWALDEVVRGVNPWRRFLGAAVLIYLASTVRL